MESSKVKLWVLTALLVCAFSLQSVNAQTFAEFFSQKKKQREYLLKQIAGLQLYLGYVKKGYNIANTGWQTVKGFTNGEFSLHNAFISSLASVSPAIRNSAKVAGTIEMQLSISQGLNVLKSSDWLTASDQAYVAQVREKVLSDCAGDLEELLLATTSGKLEMTDDERLNRLEQVYLSMQEKAAFAQSFSATVNSLIVQRKSEQESITKIRRYYEPD